MKHIHNNHWNEKMVMVYLEEAADIHRRLPDVKAPGYFNLWPETLKDDWERLYDAINGKNHLGAPMPQEVTFHEEVMDWLKFLDRYHQQLIWMRANRVPWKVLSLHYDKDRTALWRDLNCGLTKISMMLSIKDSGPEQHVAETLQHER